MCVCVLWLQSQYRLIYKTYPHYLHQQLQQFSRYTKRFQTSMPIYVTFPCSCISLYNVQEIFIYSLSKLSSGNNATRKFLAPPKPQQSPFSLPNIFIPFLASLFYLYCIIHLSIYVSFNQTESSLEVYCLSWSFRQH